MDRSWRNQGSFRSSGAWGRTATGEQGQMGARGTKVVSGAQGTRAAVPWAGTDGSYRWNQDCSAL